MSKSVLSFCGNSPSPRLKHAAEVVAGWWGMEVNWTEQGAVPGWVSLEVNGTRVACWQTHPMVEIGASTKTRVAFFRWQWDGRIPFELMLPCASESGLDLPGELKGTLQLPLDPLACTFWGISCWQEQSEELERDAHGRPTTSRLPWTKESGKASFGGKELPMMWQHRWPWLELMWSALFKEWLGLERPYLTFRPTVDVDVAFKHLGRPWYKTLLLHARDFATFRWSNALERSRVIRVLKPDPYDTFGFLREVHRDEPLMWFVLAADRKKPHDVGLDPRRAVLPHLVQSLSSHSADVEVCCHPGYQAVEDPQTRKKECARFWGWEGANSNIVRAHFLRSEPGPGWRMWEDLGVREDASLGWSREVGFRAGTSRAFRAYDVEADRPLALKVHPVAAMDSAMTRGLNWNPEEAKGQLDEMMEVVSAAGGTWMSCWHNTSVSDRDEWVGWRATYLHMVQTARSLSRRTL